MPNKLQRRFVELSVGEVSLVDSPANEEEFAVIKRLNQEDDNMGDIEKTKVTKADDKEQKTEVEEAADGKDEIEKVPVEVAKATNEAVEKAMKQVVDVVENIAKAVAAEEKPAEEKPDEADEDDAAVKKAKADAEKPADKPAEKKEEDETEDADDVDVSKVLEALEQGIQKAKQFTPGRVAKLKDMADTLQKLLSEVTTKEAATKALPSGAKFGDSKVIELTKAIMALNDSITKHFQTTIETTKALHERVETIEKARNPSQSIEGDGGTDDLEKVEKSFWSGLL